MLRDRVLMSSSLVLAFHEKDVWQSESLPREMREEEALRHKTLSELTTLGGKGEGK